MELTKEQQAQVRMILGLIAMKETEITALKTYLNSVLGVDVEKDQYILDVEKGILERANATTQATGL